MNGRGKLLRFESLEAYQDGVLLGRFVPNLNVGMNSFEAKQTICIPSSNCQHITLVACRGSTKNRWPGWNEVQNQYIPSNRIWFCGVPLSVSMIVRVFLKAVCYEGRFDPAFFGILVGCQHHEFMASWFRLKNLLGNGTLGTWKTQELGWETNLGSFQIIRFCEKMVTPPNPSPSVPRLFVHGAVVHSKSSGQNVGRTEKCRNNPTSIYTPWKTECILIEKKLWQKCTCIFTPQTIFPRKQFSHQGTRQ